MVNSWFSAIGRSWVQQSRPHAPLAVLAVPAAEESSTQALWMFAALIIAVNLFAAAVLVPLMLAGIYLPRLVRRLRWEVGRRRWRTRQRRWEEWQRRQPPAAPPAPRQ